MLFMNILKRFSEAALKCDIVGKEDNYKYLVALQHQFYPASRGFSLVFLSVVLPFSSLFWLLAFCFGCFCAEEKTSADSRLGFLLSMREMKMRLPWNFCVTCR